MKALLILVSTLLVTVSASAYTPSVSDSWDTIRSNYDVEVDEPSVRLDVGALTTSAFFVCKDDDQLRTLKKFTRCLEWSHDDDEDPSSFCLEEQKYYGTAAIEATRQRCVSWRDVDSGDSVESICTQYENYTYTQPLSFDVDVYADSQDDYRGPKLFTKKLTIKDCE